MFSIFRRYTYYFYQLPLYIYYEIVHKVQKREVQNVYKKCKQETRAESTQNRNLPVSAVNTALWNSPLLGI